MAEAVSIVRANRAHRCDGSFGTRHLIRAGQIYRRTVVFPGDVNTSNRPWTHRCCADCAERNNRPILGVLTHTRARAEHTLLQRVAPGVWTGPVDHGRGCPCAVPAGVVAVLIVAPLAGVVAAPAAVLHVGKLRYPIEATGGVFAAMDIAYGLLRREHDLTVEWDGDPHGHRYLARPPTRLSPETQALLDQAATFTP